MAKFNEWVDSHWEMFTWTGPKKAPYGELIRPSTLPSVDYANPREKEITTTIDCFCTGTYIDQRGKMFTIRQRYSIEITYSNSTIIETMKDRRGKVRKNVRSLRMSGQKIIIGEAKDAGFTMLGQYDLIKSQREYQYIYILYKPSN